MGLFSPNKILTNRQSQSITNLNAHNIINTNVNSPRATTSGQINKNNAVSTNFMEIPKFQPKSATSLNSEINKNESNMSDTNNKIVQDLDNEMNVNESLPLVQTGIERYVTVTSKRKRNPKSPEEAVSNLKSVKLNPSGIISGNRFEVLQVEGDNKDEEEEPKERPPPIYLREAPSKPLLATLNAETSENFFIAHIKRGNISETKIQAKNIDGYRKIVAALEEKGKYFYTYCLKSAKGITVVIKGIESTVQPEEISEELTKMNFKVKSVINIINRDGNPQPMFKVELEPEVKKTKGKHAIYDIRYLLYRKVVVEEPHKRKSVLQCTNCQEYGHSRNYCKLPSVCVICGKLHDSSKCELDKSKPEARKCSNCGENHTANYRGCMVYQELRKKMTPRQRAEQQALNHIFKSQTNANQMSATINPKISYAQAVRGNTLNPTPNDDQGIYKVINTLNESMNKFMQMMETNMSLMLQNMNTLMQLLIKNQK